MSRRCRGLLLLKVMVLTSLLIIIITCYLDNNSTHMHLEPRVSYVCQTDNGRLGNHLFQYASIYGIAKRNNRTIIIGKDDDLAQYFRVATAERRKNRDVCKSFRRLIAPLCCSYDATLMDLEPGTNYMLGEYLQSWQYFKGVANEVRKELEFQDFILKDINYILNNLRELYKLKFSATPVFVGVHIRRGDIVTNEFMHTDGVVLSPDQYLFNAIDFFIARHGLNIVFVVCSDSMDHARIVMKYRNMSVEFFHISPIYDLALLASCDHFLGTVGTFGWMAGFLCKGDVTFYACPMREGSPIRKSYNYPEFFFPDWYMLDGLPPSINTISPYVGDKREAYNYSMCAVQPDLGYS